MIAKVLSLQSVLIENQVVFFLLVTIVSFLMAWGINQYIRSRQHEDKPLYTKPKRAWIEIDLDCLTSNIHAIQSAIKPKTEIIAVATIQEAIRLRTHGVQGKILILGYTPSCQARYLERYHLTQTVFDYEYAKELNQCKRKISIHIKLVLIVTL